MHALHHTCWPWLRHVQKKTVCLHACTALHCTALHCTCMRKPPTFCLPLPSPYSTQRVVPANVPAHRHVTRGSRGFEAHHADPVYDKDVQELASGDGPVDVTVVEVPEATLKANNMYEWRWRRDGDCVMSEAHFNATVSGVVVGKGGAGGGGRRLGGGALCTRLYDQYAARTEPRRQTAQERCALPSAYLLCSAMLPLPVTARRASSGRSAPGCCCKSHSSCATIAACHRPPAAILSTLAAA